MIILFAFIPTWLKSQERLILTEESILQVLQPGVFANKVSQLGLQHVNDVSVRQGFFGNIFNFGMVTIETPGEQQNYVFPMVKNAQLAAREIIEAHESYDAALQSGRVPSNYGDIAAVSAKANYQVGRDEYEEFLAFKQAMDAEKQKQAALNNQGSVSLDSADQTTVASSDHQSLPPISRW